MLTKTARPFSWDKFAGQKGIVKEMKKRSRTLDFADVMIFEGDSGTGKTTMAFMIAALINDKDPIIHDDGTKDPNPESKICKTIIDETFSQAVTFYDASTMGKAEVEKLEEVCSSRSIYPGQSKVLIIDEAQELSKAGKGVALKLLERKRKNVFIILCTMDISKFDKAVKSRGACYTFRKISTDDIGDSLFSLLNAHEDSEKVPEEFITEGLLTIADAANGSLRDAVQTFERCLYGEFYTKEDILREFRIMTKEFVSDVLATLFVKNDPKGILMLDNVDFEQFFFMSRKAILNAYIFKLTGIIPPKYKWQKKIFEQMASARHKDILDAYKVSMIGGFKPNEDLFKAEILNLFESTDPVIKEEKPAAGTREKSGNRVRSGSK